MRHSLDVGVMISNLTVLKQALLQRNEVCQHFDTAEDYLRNDLTTISYSTYGNQRRDQDMHGCSKVQEIVES